MEEQLSYYYLDQPEPLKSALMALSDLIVAFDPDIQVAWKYASPFFVYRNKNLCYLWVDKSNNHPYIGFIDGSQLDHPLLASGERKQIRILPIDPEQDFPVEALHQILAAALPLCADRGKTG